LIIAVQETHEQIVVQIVMPFGNLVGAGLGLAVKAGGNKFQKCFLKTTAYALIQAGIKQVEEKFIQAFTVPPSLHVGLAQAEVFLPDNPTEEAVVMYLNVPGVGTVDLYAGFSQKFLDLAASKHTAPPAFRC
jgi:hypothetical protein